MKLNSDSEFESLIYSNLCKDHEFPIIRNDIFLSSIAE